MAGIVEENGNTSDPLIDHINDEHGNVVSSGDAASSTPHSTAGGGQGGGTQSTATAISLAVSQAGQRQSQQQTQQVLTTSANIVQFIPAPSNQANQSSVIQTAAANIPPLALGKSVLYVNKPNSVIHTAPGLQIKTEPTGAHHQSTQLLDTNSEDSLTDEDSPKRRRDLLTRRPSYHRILKEISGPDIVIPTTTLQIANVTGGDSSASIHSISSSGTGGPTLVQYTQTQDGQSFFVPVTSNPLAEDQSRKREIRLQKNREAARECRRKKKEYIKCLENRVAVLENQNKALIEELKALKELYCSTKIE